MAVDTNQELNDVNTFLDCGLIQKFTDNFTGRLIDAFTELEDLIMSEETKVMKFRAAFQVKEFGHLHSMMASIRCC